MRRKITNVNKNSSGKLLWGSIIGIVLSIGIISGVVLGLPDVQTILADTFIEQSQIYMASKQENDSLKIELNDTNDDLSSTQNELDLANEELLLLKNDISHLENQVNTYETERDELIRSFNEMQEDDDLYLQLYIIRYDLHLNNDQIIYDIAPQQCDQKYISRSDLINSLPLQINNIQKCYWYDLICRSLNKNERVLKSVYYNASNAISKEIVFIDEITGEEISSISDYIDYYEDVDTFEICADFFSTTEIEFYTAEECDANGYYHSDISMPVKSIRITLKIHPMFHLVKGLYISDEGDRIQLNNSSSTYGVAYYHGRFCNYGDNRSSIDFFNFQDGTYSSYKGDIISNESFIIDDKLYTLAQAN